MGYILPILHDTYNQYVNRTIYKEAPYSEITPVTKSKQANLNEEMGSQLKPETAVQSKVKKNKYNDSFLTGKGQFINEYI